MKLDRIVLGFGAAVLLASSGYSQIMGPDQEWTFEGSYATVFNGTDYVPDLGDPTSSSGLTVGQAYEAPFGDYDSPTPNSPFPANNTLALQTTVDLTGYDLASVEYSISIDNNYILTINGVTLPEFDHGGVAAYAPYEAMPDLVAGVNTLDIDVIDYGDFTYFDMLMEGNPGSNSVPDGANTAVLLAAAGAALVWLRRKLTGRAATPA